MIMAADQLVPSPVMLIPEATHEAVSIAPAEDLALDLKESAIDNRAEARTTGER
jgi:hypothetical protein